MPEPRKRWNEDGWIDAAIVAVAWLVLLALASGCDDGCITIGEPDSTPAVSPSPCPQPSPRPSPCPDGRCPGTVGRWPPVDLPPSLRQANYGGGSCMHAAMISILRWQGRGELADQWRRNYSGAAGVWTLAKLAEKYDLDYAWTTDGDPAFLQWASDTRRGAAIHYKPVHAVAFLGYQTRGGLEYAVLYDNNASRDRLEYVEKNAFIRAWRGYGGCALTIVGTPANPRPYL